MRYGHAGRLSSTYMGPTGTGTTGCTERATTACTGTGTTLDWFVCGDGFDRRDRRDDMDRLYAAGIENWFLWHAALRCLADGATAPSATPIPGHQHLQTTDSPHRRSRSSSRLEA